MSHRVHTVKTLMWLIVYYSVLMTLVLAGASALIGGLINGWSGVYGGLMGTAMAGVFFMTTAVVVAMTSRSSPMIMAGALLGSFVLKMLVLMIATFVLAPLDFYDRRVLFAALAIGAVASVVMDAICVQKARLPLVDPPQK